MLAYEAYSPKPSVEYTCPICFDTDTSEKSDAIAHLGSGQLHPVHKACARLWFEAHNTCPHCRKEIDRGSLFSSMERCVFELKCVARDAFNGVVISVPFCIIVETVANMVFPIMGLPMADPSRAVYAIVGAAAFIACGISDRYRD